MIESKASLTCMPKSFLLLHLVDSGWLMSVKTEYTYNIVSYITCTCIMYTHKCKKKQNLPEMTINL